MTSGRSSAVLVRSLRALWRWTSIAIAPLRCWPWSMFFLDITGIITGIHIFRFWGREPDLKHIMVVQGIRLISCCCCCCWLLVVGCWLLVVGCWLLVVGCWLWLLLLLLLLLLFVVGCGCGCGCGCVVVVVVVVFRFFGAPPLKFKTCFNSRMLVPPWLLEPSWKRILK